MDKDKDNGKIYYDEVDGNQDNIQPYNNNRRRPISLDELQELDKIIGAKANYVGVDMYEAGIESKSLTPDAWAGIENAIIQACENFALERNVILLEGTIENMIREAKSEMRIAMARVTLTAPKLSRDYRAVIRNRRLRRR